MSTPAPLIHPAALAMLYDCPWPRAAEWAPWLDAACRDYDIATPRRIAAWLAQVWHETAALTRLRENLNYSATGLARTWPRRFAAPGGGPNAAALVLAHHPERIANTVYAARIGNGPEQSGDGWRFIGRGPGLTGRANYAAFGAAVGQDFLAHPERLETPQWCAAAAGWFWRRGDLDRYADAGDFDGVCDLWNIGRKTLQDGDAIGYADRARLYRKALESLG